MSDSINRRAAAIRDYLARMDKDPVIARRYSIVAARWDTLRLAMDRGKTTPAEDARFRELSGLLQVLTSQLGFGPGLTSWKGFLPGDPQRLICAEWRKAAEGW